MLGVAIPALIGLGGLSCACFSGSIADQRARAHFSATDLQSTEPAMRRRVRRFRRTARLLNIVIGGSIAILVALSFLH
jgi:hypothetical protein